AAAVQRGASQLADALEELLSAERALAEPLAKPAFAGTIEGLRKSVRAGAARPVDLDAVTRGDREEEVESWLDARQVADPGALSPTLVTLGYDVAKLEKLAADVGTADPPALVRWLGAPQLVWNRLAAAPQGAGRI